MTRCGKNLGTLAAQPPGKSEILGLNGHTLGVDRGKICVFEKGDEVSLSGLLQSHDGRGLESEVGLEVLSDLTNETLEGQLPDQELGRLLVPTDLSQSHSTGAEPMRLLHATSCLKTKLENGRRENARENAYSRLFASGRGLGSELLPWGLATGGFTSSLLRAGH